jgi:release factor glutamine methyltransferase
MRRLTAEARRGGTALTAATLLDQASNELREISAEDASLEAQVLLAYALGIDRSRLLAMLSEPVASEAQSWFEALVARRRAREPLAYIVGRREFYGIEIACSPAALIPRPETEMLVGLALEEIGRRGAEVQVCDVGTGSGAVAVAIAAHDARARVVATDASEDALRLARENGQRNAVANRIDFVRRDLCSGLGRFDVIVANLPYVSEEEWQDLEPEIRDYEPRGALVGGITGTEVIERLLHEAPAHLHEGGVLAVEIGATQGPRIMSVARKSLLRARIELMRDLAGLDRVVAIYTEEQDR